MNKFKINRDSWHYKLNKNFLNVNGVSDRLMQDLWEPIHNNFCSYWRVTVIRLFALGLMTTFVGSIVVMLVVSLIMYPIQVVNIVGFIIGIIASIAAMMFSFCLIGMTKEKLSEKYENSDSLFVTKYKSWKHKICPSVEFKERN